MVLKYSFSVAITLIIFVAPKTQNTQAGITRSSLVDSFLASIVRKVAQVNVSLSEVGSAAVFFSTVFGTVVTFLARLPRYSVLLYGMELKSFNGS